MPRINPVGPMGRSALQNIFDLIEMHAHLDAPRGSIGPQLTFEAEKQLLQEVMWLRSSISHQLGWHLPVPALPQPESANEEEWMAATTPPPPDLFETMGDRVSRGPVPIEEVFQSAFKGIPPDPKQPTFIPDREQVERVPIMDQQPAPKSGMSSWGDNPGSEEAAARTSCGEVDASDFEAQETIPVVCDDPSHGCESAGFASMRDYLQQLYAEKEAPGALDYDRNYYQAAINMLVAYLAAEEGMGRTEAYQHAHAIAKENYKMPAEEEITIPFEGIKEVHVHSNIVSTPVTVGRIVHYRSYGTPGGEYPPECRAAIVTEVHQNLDYPQQASLAVFNPSGIFLNQEVDQHEAEGLDIAYVGGTWHWPRSCNHKA